MNVSLDHYSRTVVNLDAVADFFIKYFGFKPRVRRDQVCEKYIDDILNIDNACLNMLFLDGCGITIELFRFIRPKACKLDTRTINPGSTHLCFCVDNIFELCERMKKDGVRFVSKKPIFIDKGNHYGGYSLYLLDPDDSVIELIQFP